MDVGANIGYTVNVMAHRLKRGTVHAFESHPAIYKELEANVDLLKSQGSLTEIHTYPCALGRSTGKLPLHIPADFEKYRGESSLTKPSHLPVNSQTTLVQVDTLAGRICGASDIGVMKIDVEGFELQVLAGGNSLFEGRRIRDCVFEEHGTYPTSVTEWFVERGYTVFRIDRSFRKPLLLEPRDSKGRTNWTATNYLATSDWTRAKHLFAKDGWVCLKPR